MHFRESSYGFAHHYENQLVVALGFTPRPAHHLIPQFVSGLSLFSAIETGPRQ